MTTRRRRFLSLPALALVVLVVSACGGGSPTTGSSTTAPGPDAAAGQSPPRTPSGGSPQQHAGPLPGHPKLGPKAAPGPAGAPRQSGDSSRSSRPRTGEPGNASRPAPAAAGDTSAPAGKQHAALTRASARAAERTARRHAQAAQHKLAQEAGKAAPFLVPVGDNSIPTYGAEASAGEVAAAEAALSVYLGARAAGEWARACGQMSAQVTKQLASLAGEGGAAGGCPQAYAKLAERTPASARADPLTGGLTALRVESPHAFALFYGPGSQQYMMPLEEEGSAWKVTQIESVPWPIGSTGE